MLRRVKIEITAEIDDATPGYGPAGERNLKEMIRCLLCDSFAEFRNVRQDIEAYMAARYPEQPGYDWMDREQKAQEIAARLFHAETLRQASAGHLNVELVKDSDANENLPG